MYHSLPLLGAQAPGRVFEGIAEEVEDGAVVLHEDGALRHERVRKRGDQVDDAVAQPCAMGAWQDDAAGAPVTSQGLSGLLGPGFIWPRDCLAQGLSGPRIIWPRVCLAQG